MEKLGKMSILQFVRRTETFSRIYKFLRGHLHPGWTLFARFHRIHDRLDFKRQTLQILRGKYFLISGKSDSLKKILNKETERSCRQKKKKKKISKIIKEWQYFCTLREGYCKKVKDCMKESPTTQVHNTEKCINEARFKSKGTNFFSPSVVTLMQQNYSQLINCDKTNMSV